MVLSTGPFSGTRSRFNQNPSALGITTGEALARVNREEINSYIQAWEEKQRANTNNRFERAIAKVSAWENGKKAASEAKMRQSIQELERKKAIITEKMKNEMAEVHRLAQQKVAKANAKRQGELVRINEKAITFRSQGLRPTKRLLCFEG
ncbi:hypothetical protein GOP47_0022497 [Adiantum capillus-veneris]|uniref:Remorin C-terminal domain-containing protein n=1 Tax=Adiantum capillus-veneris TaxID=13818 RepID=A0A9D4Z4B2_ADICA|nr:hypothetical protein GOP47_0022497 [Adiantum capillus-veneris]